MMRPTYLKLLADHCPHALEQAASGVPYPREIFATGTAAHDVLYAVSIGDLNDADAIARRLMVEGRRGYDSEPPLPVDDVIEGHRLALDYLDVWQPPLVSDGAHFEVKLCVTRDWQPVDEDDPRAVFGPRLDVVYRDIDGGDDGDGEWATDPIPGISVDDYKSSWVADDSHLDRIQQKAQAVVTWAHREKLGMGDAEWLRVGLRNLRTKRYHSRTLWAGDDLEETLEQWRHELGLAIDVGNRVLEKGGRASPGLRCMGCPFTERCPAFAVYFDGLDLVDAAHAAERYAMADEARSAAGKYLRSHLAKGETVATDGGEVGYLAQPRRQLRKGAIAEILAEWIPPTAEIDEGTLGSIRAMLQTADLGVTAVEKLGKALFPERSSKPERDEWVASMVETINVPRFGARRTR